MRLWLLLAPVLLTFSVSLPATAQEATPVPSDPAMTLIGHDGAVIDLAYSPDGSLLASIGDDKTLRVWDTATGAAKLKLTLDAAAHRVGMLSNDLVVAISGKTLTAWHLQDGKIAGSFSLDGEIHDLSVSADGDTFALATDQGLYMINMVGLNVGQGKRLIGKADQAWYSVAVSPDGTLVAAAGAPDGDALDIRSWRLSGDPVQVYSPVTDDYITDLAFNADGTQLASAGLEAQVWDTRSGELQSFSGSSLDGESGVSFAGTLLLSKVYGYDFSSPQLIYDLGSGNRLASLKRQSDKKSLGGGGGYVYQPILTSPDGRHFASADLDGVISIWSLPFTRGIRANTANIIAYCNLLKDAPLKPSPTDSVNLIWSWYATEPKLIRDHVRESHYRITIDGKVLNADQAARSLVQREPVNNNEWTLYYTLNVGPLAAGKHTVSYRGTWDHAINDGHDSYGLGTLNPDSSGDCTFTVK